MTKTLIVPGLDGSPAPHLQHWWAATDPNALMVELSDPSRPVPAVWEIELAAMILRHPDSILVGHSLGAVLIARLLATWPHLRVRAALLVAPAETTGNDLIGQFGAIRTSGSGENTKLDAGIVFDCRGIRRDPARHASPLIAGLLASGAARIDQLNIGLDVDLSCRLIG